MKCIKCGFELSDNSKFCSECGTKQNGQLSFYNWLAFISYSHKDSEVAKYIESELKKYKLPLIIEQNNPDLKKLRFDQIFRDENNFGNGSLEDQIQFGLQNSKFLIAICSPNYAKANNEGINWCDEEVKQFLSYHNNDDTRIIPVIIDGVPHSDNECFPPSLLNFKTENGKSKEALGIAGTFIKNLLVEGQEKTEISTSEKQAKDEIFDAIKARLLGLNYGAYKNYAHQEKYYLDYVDVNGIPKGINELVNGAWNHVRHYKFIYREDLLDEVRFENGSAALVVPENEEKIFDSVFFYDEKGSLLKIEQRDIHGKVSCVNEFKKNYCVINYTNAEDDSKKLDANFSVSSAANGMISHKSDVKSIRLTRDENGYILTKSYHKYHSEIYPVSDNDGVYGIEYENDAEGRVVKLWYLNASGEHFATQTGISGKIFEYDKNGFLIKESFIDSNNNLTINTKGFALVENTYDSYGRKIKCTYYDKTNQRVIAKKGYNSVVSDFDDAGNPVQISYYGLENEKVSAKDGYSSFTNVYDERGNIVKQSYFGINGEPVLKADGVSCTVQVVDSRNYIIQQEYYGINNEPVLIKPDCVAKVVNVFDENGKPLEGKFFGTDGKPICRKTSGDARMCIKRNKEGNPVEVTLYGTENQPVLNKQKYHKMCITYDDYGNPVERSYFGIDNKLCLCTDGYAIDRSVYDARGRRLQINYFGVSNERVLCVNGYSTEKSIFDEQGNAIELSYFGINEEPVLNAGGAHILRCSYDKAGYRTELTNFGINGESILCSDGYFKECGKYDDYGEITEISYYGLQGEFVIEKNSGCSRIILKYNCGNIIEKSSLGINGITKLERFNKLGNQIEFAQYDAQNQPIEDKNGHTHYFFVYFEDDRIINSVKRYNKDGSYSMSIYNKNGDEIELAYYNKDDCLVNGKSYAKKCTKYDANHKKTEMQEFKEDGTSSVFKYNSLDKISEECYLDAEGNLRINSKGYAKCTYTYDERRNVLGYTFYGTDGLKMLYRNYTSVKSMYDEKNNCIQTAFFGLNDEPVFNMTDRHKWIAVYDEKGNKIEECSYGIQGEPVLHKNGYFKWQKTFDEQGNCTLTVYFDTDNKEIKRE